MTPLKRLSSRRISSGLTVLSLIGYALTWWTSMWDIPGFDELGYRLLNDFWLLFLTLGLAYTWYVVRQLRKEHQQVPWHWWICLALLLLPLLSFALYAMVAVFRIAVFPSL
jgi:hypothetical protein